LLHDGLRRRGLDVLSAACADECLELVHRHKVDVVIADAVMPSVSGIELCRLLHDSRPDLLTIVITAHARVETAVDAMRAGAYDFLVKPVHLDAVMIAVARALDHLALRREVARLRYHSRGHPLEGIVGSSTVIKGILELIRRVADSDATVLVTGESGAGKE